MPENWSVSDKVQTHIQENKHVFLRVITQWFGS